MFIMAYTSMILFLFFTGIMKKIMAHKYCSIKFMSSIAFSCITSLIYPNYWFSVQVMLQFVKLCIGLCCNSSAQYVFMKSKLLLNICYLTLSHMMPCLVCLFMELCVFDLFCLLFVSPFHRLGFTNQALKLFLPIL